MCKNSQLHVRFRPFKSHCASSPCLFCTKLPRYAFNVLLSKNTRQNSYVLKLFRQSTHIVSLQNLRKRPLITCPPENRHDIDHVFNSNNVLIDVVLLRKLYLGLRISALRKTLGFSSNVLVLQKNGQRSHHVSKSHNVFP
jgi:hypothetical protein